MAKTPKIIRRESYPYGYLDLCEDRILVHPASYATIAQRDSLMQDALLYAANASKPVKVLPG